MICNHCIFAAPPPPFLCYPIHRGCACFVRSPPMFFCRGTGLQNRHHESACECARTHLRPWLKMAARRVATSSSQSALLLRQYSCESGPCRLPPPRGCQRTFHVGRTVGPEDGARAVLFLVHQRLCQVLRLRPRRHKPWSLGGRLVFLVSFLIRTGSGWPPIPRPRKVTGVSQWSVGGQIWVAKPASRTRRVPSPVRTHTCAHSPQEWRRRPTAARCGRR